MHEYFEAEMRLLREAAQEFAAKYPEQARMLNLSAINDRDPYIERLLEGFAFLTAQIRHKIDDDIPEICASLLWQLWPHLLRPFPSATIVQFKSRPGQLQQTYTIPKGTMLQSQQPAVCRFRTTSSVKLNPIQITEVKTGGSAIKLKLQITPGVTGDDLNLDQLKIYLHADPGLALLLHFVLLRQTKQIKIIFPEYPTHQEIIIGTEHSIKPTHFDIENILLPQNKRSFLGFHLLHEYFLFREKYLFITLPKLQPNLWPKPCQQIIIVIQTKEIFSHDIQINQDNFCLHCAPAINLYTETSEPIKLDHKQSEYPVLIDGANRILHSVDEVTATEEITGQRHIYQPLYAVDKHYYQIIFRDEKGYISFDLAEATQQEISCEITVSDGHYPRRFLQENTLSIAAGNLPNYIQFANIIRPTPMFSPPKRNNYRWTLISQLALNYESITNLPNLQQLLTIYDWSKYHENTRRIQSIYELQVTPINQVYQGALTQGLRFDLKVYEDAFSSMADIHLFGLVLHHFFSMYISINYFVITRIFCHPSNQEFTWQPLFGANYPI